MATHSKKTSAKKTTARDISAPDLAPAASLGSRFVVRVLLITQPLLTQPVATQSDVAASDVVERRDDSPALAMRDLLTQDGHIVTVTTPAEWQLAVRDMLPEVILLDATCANNGPNGKPNYRALAALCRQVREAQEVRDAPLAVLLAAEADKGNDGLSGLPWAELRAAGADDILTSRSSHIEVEAHLALLAHYGRIRRDLSVARDQLNRHTQFDEVTQLMNRRFFFQAAHRETSRARRYHHTLACLMVDVDYFDRITKNYGYSCGDYVLRTVSYIVRQWTRESDILGRFGEAKIAVLLPETIVEGAAVVRDKIQRAVMEGNFEWNNEKLPVSVSIGEADRRWDEAETEVEPEPKPIVESHDDQLQEEEVESLSVREELAELLADADAALNISKKAALCPPVFVEYAPEPDALAETS